MRTIYKYRLAVEAVSSFEMPVASRIIYVGNQNGSVHIWAEVETKHTTEGRHFVIAGTGSDLPDGTYIGTALVPPFVWHVYEVGGKS